MYQCRSPGLRKTLSGRGQGIEVLKVGAIEEFVTKTMVGLYVAHYAPAGLYGTACGSFYFMEAHVYHVSNLCLNK